MTTALPRVLLAVASLSAALGAGGRQELASAPQVQPQQPRPTFRSGVDLVPIDVVVLDNDRRPVKGLRAEDFTVTEDDDPQAIETFEEVDVPEPEADAPAWMRDVAPDVVSNDIQTRRLLLLVLDDANVNVEHGETKSLRQIANQVIDGLGPSDLAAVMYTFLGRVESFTSDRRKLRAAVEAFAPHGWGGAGPPLGCQLRPGGCAVDTISRVADVLRTAPGGRKLLVFISPQLSTGAEISERPDEFKGLDAIRTMFANLQLANVSVYSYDPRGLTGATASPKEIGLAEATGGRRVASTNAPEDHVSQMFRESSAYYLIGYRTTHPRTDGRFRRIRVAVNRPGLDVRTRNGYFAAKSSNRTSPTRTAVQQVDQAIQQGFPVSDVLVRATTAAFAARDGRTTELVSVLALREPALIGSTTPAAAAPRKRVEVVAAAFDMKGRSKGLYRQAIELTLRPDAQSGSEYEVTSRLPLAPGRYEIRIAAVVDGRAGSVFTTVEIPRFAKERLSLSGVVLEKRPAPLAASRSLLADLLPVTPTAARVFGSGDEAAAFLRVYQGGTRPPEPVIMTVRLTDAHDVVRTTSTWRLLPHAFSRARTADVTWPLAGEGLAPGDYLLTFEATAGDYRAVQHLRFRLTGPSTPSRAPAPQGARPMPSNTRIH
jgi:VWFA-related protein